MKARRQQWQRLYGDLWDLPDEAISVMKDDCEMIPKDSHGIGKTHLMHCFLKHE
jgi:hypothetical protein